MLCLIRNRKAGHDIGDVLLSPDDESLDFIIEREEASVWYADGPP